MQCVILGLVLILLQLSCAGPKLNKEDMDVLKHKELSKELLAQFEVKEFELKKPPVVEPSLAPVVKVAKKSQKKKKSPLPTPSALEIPPMPMPSPHFFIPSRSPVKTPIFPSEKLVLEITYFGVSAGIFTLKVLPYKSVHERKVYHIQGNAKSSKLFSLFYTLDDTVETFLDYDGLFSHRFHIVLDETKQTRDSLELYDSEGKRMFYWNRWNHKTKGYTEIKDFFPMEPFPQDSLSALYYLRTLKYQEGTVIRFPVASEGKCWEAVVTLERKEMLKTPLGRIPTLVLKLEAQYQGILQKRGDSFLWLSDDERRIPLRLEAKVKIGTVVAALKAYEPGVAP